MVRATGVARIGGLTHMPQLLIMVPVPEVEPHIAQLRARFDPSAKRGLRAHVTLVHANMPSGPLEPIFLQHLAASVSSMAPFEYQITRVGRFPATLYLAAEPAGPFVLLRARLVPALGTTERERQARETLVPHISVVRKSASDDHGVELELTSTLRSYGPIPCACRELELLENSSGVWLPVERLRLGGGTDNPWRGPS